MKYNPSFNSDSTIAGNTGESAAIGAGIGALARLFRKREEQQQTQQAQAQVSQQENQGFARYYQA